MSLRLRLIGAITVILLASLTLGGLITTWHARQSVASELGAAMVAAAEGHSGGRAFAASRAVSDGNR